MTSCCDVFLEAEEIRGDFEKAQQRIHDMIRSKQAKATVCRYSELIHDLTFYFRSTCLILLFKSPQTETAASIRAKNDVVRTDIRSAQKFLEQNLSTPNKQQSTDTAAPAAAVDNDVRRRGRRPLVVLVTRPGSIVSFFSFHSTRNLSIG